MLALVVSSPLCPAVSFSHSHHLNFFVLRASTLAFMRPSLSLSPPLLPRLSPFVDSQTSLFFLHVRRSSTWWSSTVTHASSSPPFTKSACVLRWTADPCRTPTRSPAVQRPQNTAPALTALHFPLRKRCHCCFLTALKGLFIEVRHCWHFSLVWHSRLNLCFGFSTNRKPESRGQGGRSTKTAEMRAPTRSAACSSRGPATGASGRARRRRKLGTLTSVRN